MKTIEEAIPKVFGVVNAFKQAKEVNSPGGEKITLGEKIKIGIKGFGIVEIVGSLQKLKEDWRSRDIQKKDAWAVAFKKEFDIADDELEEQIEEAVSALIHLEEVFTKISFLKK